MGKFCSSCGMAMDDNANFCRGCGSKDVVLAAHPQAQPQQKAPVYGTLAPDPTGKYRWYYEVNMFKNPSLLITLYKVFGGIVVGCALGLGLILWLSTGELSSAWGVMKGFGIAGIIILVLVSVAYLIFAAVQGGRYCVIFEMDDKNVTHTQLARQFEKAQVIAGLTALAGAATGSLTLVGTGLLAGSRSQMNTCFENVDRVKVRRGRNVVYLRSFMSWNHIYVQQQDFDFVLSYMLERIPGSAGRRGL